MNMLTKRTTIYFDPRLHRALRIKSAETERSVSDIVNEAIRVNLAEDQLDLEAFDERKHEPLLTFKDVLKSLKRDGRI